MCNVAAGKVLFFRVFALAMVIVMVADSWDQPFNGTVVSSRRFAKALLDRGHSVRVLALEGDEHPLPGIELYRLPALAIPGISSLMRRMRTVLAVPVRRVIDEALRGADVLHVQFPFFVGGAAISRARHWQVPVVASFHLQAENILRNLYLPNRLFSPVVYGLFRRFVFARADLALAPSPFAARLIKSLGIETPVVVLSNGVPEAQLQVYKHRAGMPASVRVLCVGRLAREKRYDVIAHAIAQTQIPERFQITFAGSGPTEKRVQALCTRLGVRARFVTPTDKELDELYSRADLFLHAGESELEGMSVMQAMAAGVPVLVSDSQMSAARELTTVDESRFRFPDADDLATRIDAVCAQPDLVARISEQNYRSVSQLAHAQAVDELESIYLKLIGAHSPGTFGQCQL
ncbi:MAG: glycosyltransferase [Pseudomonadota bacterium]